MKLPNLYFTILLILQMIPVIGGIPSLIMPITFVVSLSMIKDGIEDYQRKRSDDEENNRLVDCLPLKNESSKN